MNNIHDVPKGHQVYSTKSQDEYYFKMTTREKQVDIIISKNQALQI